MFYKLSLQYPIDYELFERILTRMLPLESECDLSDPSLPSMFHPFPSLSQMILVQLMETEESGRLSFLSFSQTLSSLLKGDIVEKLSIIYQSHPSCLECRG